MAPLGALLAAAALAAAGCGGSGDEATTVVRTVTETVPATTTPAGAAATGTTETTAPDRRAARATAEAALLRLEDLPSGWVAQDETEEPEPAGAACWRAAGVTATVADAVAPSFTGPSMSAVTNAVALFPDADAASAGVKAVGDAKLRACLARELTAFLRGSIDRDRYEEAQVFDAETAALSVAPYGAESAGFRITVPLDDGTTRAELYGDWIAIRDGAAVTQLSFISAIRPPEEAFRDDLSRTAATRLRAATGG
jgi:hypothetical protein